jgi:hypothetical protein
MNLHQLSSQVPQRSIPTAPLSLVLVFLLVLVLVLVLSVRTGASASPQSYVLRSGLLLGAGGEETMNIDRHLRRWLNDSTLTREFPSGYEGTIFEVVEERLHNRYRCTKELQPVIVFEDGWRLVPNISMRRALKEFFGSDTDEWIGRRVQVYRRLARRPGDGKEDWQKGIALPAADVAPFRRRIS